MAVESVQLDVLHGGEDKAKQIIEKWKSLTESSTTANSSNVKLEKVLVPISTQDDRVFLIWRGVDQNVPPSLPIVAMHDHAKPDHSITLSPTDFSAANWESFDETDVLELRTYILTPGNRPAIHARFRDHTMRLFERHGMKNIEYYQLFDDDHAVVGDLYKRWRRSSNKHPLQIQSQKQRIKR